MDEEEQETPRITEISTPPVRDDKEDPIPKYHDMAEPQEPIETPHETISTRKIPS